MAAVDAPMLWMDTQVDPPEPDVPEEAHHARVQFLASLPNWLTQTCTEVEALRGMPGIWLLGCAPALAPFLRRTPMLARAVLERAWFTDGALGVLLDRMSAVEPADWFDTVTDWLSLPGAQRIEAMVDRLRPVACSSGALRALGRVLEAADASFGAIA